MAARERLDIFDLRDPVEWRAGRIPGSVQLEQGQVVSDTEAILYCSCPKEADSARAGAFGCSKVDSSVGMS
jgi:rhodanese-related sulfurtransferase